MANLFELLTAAQLGLLLSVAALLLSSAAMVARHLWVFWRAQGPTVRARLKYNRCRHQWAEQWVGPPQDRHRVEQCARCGAARW